MTGARVPSGGFTLVELLVVMALLASVFALATSGWLTLGAGDKRVRSGVEQVAEAATRQAIFTSVVGRTLPWPRRENAASSMLFTGEEKALELVVARPDYEPGSAYQRWQWRVEPAVRGFVLMVSAKSFHGEDERTEDEGQIFFSFATEPRFAFLDRSRGEARWRPNWEDAGRLPDAVALLRTDGPSWIVPLRHRLVAVCVGGAAQNYDFCT